MEKRRKRKNKIIETIFYEYIVRDEINNNECLIQASLIVSYDERIRGNPTSFIHPEFMDEWWIGMRVR